MKQIILSFGCCVAVCFSAWTLHAALPGSSRQVVQENFHQLIKENSCPGCDLAGVVLTRVNLSGANLEGANLAGAKFYLADLSEANLKGANLQGTAFGGADLAGADLTGANLTGAILEGAYLTGAITDGMITNSYSSDSVNHAGETVFVADESQSKHAPYSQEVVIEKNHDLVGAQPVEEQRERRDAEGGGQPVEEQISSVIAQSKSPVPMADMVVPAPVPAVQVSVVAQENEPEQAQVEDAVVLVEQSKRKVVPSSEQVEIIKETGRVETEIESDQDPVKKIEPIKNEQQLVVNKEVVVGQDMDVTEAVAEVSVVRDEVERIGGDGADMSPSAEVEHAAVVAESDSVAPVNSSAVEEPTPENIELPSRANEELGATQGGSQGETQAEAASSLSDLVADVEEDPAPVQASVDTLVYTVETPGQAEAKHLVLLEQLLDDDRCVECDLAGVDLSGKRLKGVDLERADLQGANLEDANLSGANLKGANLSGANLRNTDLSEADLYRANLSGADLTGADLTDTLLDSADLTGVVGISSTDTVQADQ